MSQGKGQKSKEFEINDPVECRLCDVDNDKLPSWRGNPTYLMLLQSLAPIWTKISSQVQIFKAAKSMK